MSSYTFGDTDLAADRLHRLDGVFAASSAALLDPIAARSADAVRRVADLGCGPGPSTARLVSTFPQAAVVGVDASPTFVARATTSVPGARFVVADVTAPLPHAPYDLVYARFLLAHLAAIGPALRVWADALHPGGWLVLEETGSIVSTDPDFARYEELTRARVATTGASVYAGAMIRAALPPTLDVVEDRILQLDLTAGQAASMFWRNLANWGPAAVADGHLTDAERSGLLTRLRDREADDTRGLFTWTHHQVVARRR